MAKITFITLYDKGCLGIRYISSVLKKHGHSVSIIYLGSHEGKIKTKSDTFASDEDLWISINEYGADLIRSYSDPIGDKDIRIFLDLLAKLKPDIIGFSLRTMFLNTAIHLTKEIRSEIKVPIIYGGIAATSEPQRCILYADMICLGEGENSMLELANLFNRNESLESVNNFWIRKGSQIFKNPLLPLEQNLDTIPFPDYEPENKFSIFNGGLIENDSSIGNMSRFTFEMITSRGCPFACNYCCNDLLKRLYAGQKFLRRRSVKNVISELKEVKIKYNIKTVLFKDEIFTFDLDWIKDFSVAYNEEIHLPFWCYTHPSFVDEEILRLLKNSGMFSVTMGIQSGSEKILYSVFNRPTPYKKIIQAVRILESLKLPIRPRYDIITNNPFETEEDCRKTLELLMELPAPVNFGLTKLSFIPGSKIAQMKSDVPMENKLDEKTYKFWNRLYLLRQYRYFPKSWIRYFSKNKFLKNNSWVLQTLLFPRFLAVKFQDVISKAKDIIPLSAILSLKRIRQTLRGY